MSAPTINSEISTHGQITGSFTAKGSRSAWSTSCAPGPARHPEAATGQRKHHGRHPGRGHHPPGVLGGRLGLPRRAGVHDRLLPLRRPGRQHRPAGQPAADRRLHGPVRPRSRCPAWPAWCSCSAWPSMPTCSSTNVCARNANAAPACPGHPQRLRPGLPDHHRHAPDAASSPPSSSTSSATTSSRASASA